MTLSGSLGGTRAPARRFFFLPRCWRPPFPTEGVVHLVASGICWRLSSGHPLNAAFRPVRRVHPRLRQIMTPIHPPILAVALDFRATLGWGGSPPLVRARLLVRPLLVAWRGDRRACCRRRRNLARVWLPGSPRAAVGGFFPPHVGARPLGCRLVVQRGVRRSFPRRQHNMASPCPPGLGSGLPCRYWGSFLLSSLASVFGGIISLPRPRGRHKNCQKSGRRRFFHVMII